MLRPWLCSVTCLSFSSINDDPGLPSSKSISIICCLSWQWLQKALHKNVGTTLESTMLGRWCQKVRWDAPRSFAVALRHWCHTPGQIGLRGQRQWTVSQRSEDYKCKCSTWEAIWHIRIWNDVFQEVTYISMHQVSLEYTFDWLWTQDQHKTTTNQQRIICIHV